ncbi:MAG TPA: cytochrome P450 [Acidimicrobiia bacterium]|nr:cytochrome P450 [Acidimicrobiia bacterium]
MTIPLTELDIDPSVPGFFLRPDYYDVLGRLRAEAPLFEATPGTRLVSRYDDIREISRDPGRFCSSRGVLVNDPMREGLAIEGSILHTDPPRHGEYRRLLNREFTPRAVGGMEPRIRARTRDLLDAIPRGEEVDLVDVLAAPLPVTVIADVLGVAESDRSEFRRWSDAAIVASDGRADLPTEDAVAVGELVSFLGALAEAKRADPGDDVVSLLVDREIGGARLSPGELMTFNMSLLVAGNETTRHLISGGFLALAEHPDQRRRLAADPSLMPGAVEELLRWVTPIQQFARTVVADTTVGGEQVRVGEYLVMLYASGNRDEAAFGPTAADFDTLRPLSPPNLAFGFGEHLCLGAALARLEARVVFEEVLDRFADFELAGPSTYLPSSLVRGPSSLPIRFAR